MGDVRRVQGVQMLRHGAGEFSDACRRAVRMLVDVFIGICARCSESPPRYPRHVPWCLPARRSSAGDRSTPPRRRAAPRRKSPWLDSPSRIRRFVVSREAQVRQHGLQVLEELRDRLVGLAVGCHGREIEVRDVLPAGAAVRPPRSRCRQARSRACAGSLRDRRRRLRRQTELLDDVVAECRA